VQLVHSAIERNAGIPAMLDAYSEFVDNPIGPLELQDLESVFGAILSNLAERFPQIASQKAATNARNDIVAFLSAAGNNPDRVKSVLRDELRSSNKKMASSISERFSRMSGDERRAIDATLRLIRRSQDEILFRGEYDKGIESSGPEFQRFYAAVKAESPNMKELRYQNLIVEKAIFNKLILRSKDRRDNPIWVPSFFAKENVESLIDRVAVVSEHLFYARLKELKSEGRLEQIRPLLQSFIESQGIISEPIEVPAEIADFVSKSGGSLTILTPLELDDLTRLFDEEVQEEKTKQSAVAVQEQRKKEAEDRKKAEETQRERDKTRQLVAQIDSGQKVETIEEEEQRKPANSIYLGKRVDLEQFTSALNKRLPEREIEAQVKTTGDYYVNFTDVKQGGVSIVGSSGSGRSTTLRRMLDGIASASDSGNNSTKVIIIDQKGEHRGIAWKYKWTVLGFASDTQSRTVKLPPFLSKEDEEGGSELAASLLQEWLLEAGSTCSDQQRARIASIIRAQGVSATGESVSKALLAEPELVQLGQKLSKNFLSKNVLARLFSEDPQSRIDTGSGSLIFDVSGRGLRDPTTREERLISSVLIMKYLLDSDFQSSMVVLEDVLDRFKSESLRKKVVHYVSRLREKGNTIVATSRSSIREFVGGTSLEILHRLSGEKVVSEELRGFKTSQPVKNLGVIVGFLPRGYAFTSTVVGRNGSETKTVPSAAIKVEPLQFSTAS
jgi:energy-coupling factor transporter ATP-binding protein EcfA2